jgi:hypothetical protein
MIICSPGAPCTGLRVAVDQAGVCGLALLGLGVRCAAGAWVPFSACVQEHTGCICQGDEQGPSPVAGPAFPEPCQAWCEAGWATRSSGSRSSQAAPCCCRACDLPVLLLCRPPSYLLHTACITPPLGDLRLRERVW